MTLSTVCMIGDISIGNVPTGNLMCENNVDSDDKNSLICSV